MGFVHLIAGRPCFACAALVLLLTCGLAVAADQFPFDREMVLDAAPMRPAKRVPLLTVASNGEATIDLWCKTVTARVELTDDAITIEPGPLPEALPEMMGKDQCTAQRLRADEDLLAAITQVTAWRMEGSSLMLVGPKTLKFRASDH